jgi:hypothetical protein
MVWFGLVWYGICTSLNLLSLLGWSGGRWRVVGGIENKDT